jgi:hypothetical protein
MAQSARNYDKGIFPPAHDAVGGLLMGNIVQPTTAASDGTPQIIKPSGTAPELQKFYGVVESRGFVGGTGTAAGEDLCVKRQGLGTVLLGANRTATLGSELVADASTLGAVKNRTPYSSSATVIGVSEEALSSSSSSQLHEAYIQPYRIEVVRQISTFTGTIGTVTKYANGIGGTISTNFVPLYLARFDGETVRNLRIDLGTAPGGSDTVAVTVYSNAGYSTTGSASTITCTATGTAKTASDSTHTLTLSAGDVVGFYINSSANTAANITITCDVT